MKTKNLLYISLGICAAVLTYMYFVVKPSPGEALPTVRFDALPTPTSCWYPYPLPNTPRPEFVARVRAAGYQPVGWIQASDGHVYKNMRCACGYCGHYIGAVPCDENEVLVPSSGTVLPITNNTYCKGQDVAIFIGTKLASEIMTVTPTASETITPTITTTPDLDCMYQDWPVGDMMPIIPECDERRFIAQWNGYVRPNATTWECGVPRGLRGRTCPTLYSNIPENKCEAIETDYAYCEDPARWGYTCTSSYMYIEQVIYREPVPEFGWLDWGYFGRTNQWNWKPLCVWLPGTEMKCYTNWRPSQAIENAVERWKNEQ